MPRKTRDLEESAQRRAIPLTTERLRELFKGERLFGQDNGVRQSSIQKLETELADLVAQKVATVKELVPKCRTCGGENIGIKTDTHFWQRPGSIIIGPGSRGSSGSSTTFNCLYCEKCGSTFYNTEMKDRISGLLDKIQEKERNLTDLRHPHLC